VLTGISFKANPTKKQKEVLSQWMGCAKFVWNAKCAEDNYLTQFARKYLSINTYPPIDQKFSQYKNRELSPWLFNCPSQILRNMAANWFNTKKDQIKGKCGRPKIKKKGSKGSIHLTRELFSFEKCSDGNIKLFIGTKRNNIGHLSFKAHKKFKIPNSIYIIKKNGRYWISFCYEDGISEEHLKSTEEYVKELQKFDRKELEECIIGIDRGVVRPVQAGDQYFDYSDGQKKKKKKNKRKIKFLQKRAYRQQKGSKRREKTRLKTGRTHESSANIRNDFCHKTSRALVNEDKLNVFVFEDLSTSSMTRKPKPKEDERTGKFLPNNRNAKAALNDAILDKGWYQIENYTKYKAYRNGKAVLKVSARYTSQECADCGHTHPNNRKKQDLFICESCGHSGNADYNAAEVIKKRAINLILDSGTELSKSGVLLGRGRGATSKTRIANAIRASGYEALKEKGMALAVCP